MRKVPRQWALISILLVAIVLLLVLSAYFVLSRHFQQIGAESPFLNEQEYCSPAQLEKMDLRVYPNQASINGTQDVIPITVWLTGDIAEKCHFRLLAKSSTPTIHAITYLLDGNSAERLYQYEIQAKTTGVVCVEFADLPPKHCSAENHIDASLTVSELQSELLAIIPQEYRWTGNQVHNMVIIGRNFSENAIVEVAGNLANIKSVSQNILHIEFPDPISVGDSALTWVRVYNPETMTVVEKNNLSFVIK